MIRLKMVEGLPRGSWGFVKASQSDCLVYLDAVCSVEERAAALADVVGLKTDLFSGSVWGKKCIKCAPKRA